MRYNEEEKKKTFNRKRLDMICTNQVIDIKNNTLAG